MVELRLQGKGRQKLLLAANEESSSTFCRRTEEDQVIE